MWILPQDSSSFFDRTFDLNQPVLLRFLCVAKKQPLDKPNATRLLEAQMLSAKKEAKKLTFIKSLTGYIKSLVTKQKEKLWTDKQ